jgi:uncharacterized membrane protein
VTQDESELVPARQRRPGRPDRLPATALVTVALATVVLLEVHAVGYAFTLVGLDPAWASAVLVASLVGSFVDIPIARLRPRAPQVRFRLVPWFGTVYIVPVAQRRIAVTVSLNVGGAVVPTVVSGYVVARLGLSRTCGSCATLDTSAASIGGAGTFDGVFLSGVLAVLLGALL